MIVAFLNFLRRSNLLLFRAMNDEEAFEVDSLPLQSFFPKRLGSVVHTASLGGCSYGSVDITKEFFAEASSRIIL